MPSSDTQFKKGHKMGFGKQYFLGKKHTEETKRKLSVKKIGKLNPNYKRIPWNKGKKGLQIAWNKGKIGLKGEKANNWRGGTSTIHQLIRGSKEYKLWRKAVFERDNYTCIWCGEKGYLNADHIKPFSLFPELRFAIDNGRTLCIECHQKTDTFASKIYNYGK